MTARPSPSVVRLKVSCPNLGAYRERYEGEYAMNGVFIPSAQARPVGTRVHLKIQLADQTFGYSGGAVVVQHLKDRARAGYLLRLDELEVPIEVETPPASPPPPTPAPVRTHASRPAPPAPPPVPVLEIAPEPSFEVAAEPIEIAPEPSFEVDAEPVEFAPVAVHEVAPAPPVPVVVRAPAPAPRPAAGPAPTPAPATRRGGRRLALVVAVAVVMVPAAAAALWLRAAQRRAADTEWAFASEISAADDRLRAGRLAAPAGDSALDHLDAARRLLPADGRLTSRGGALAETFEGLGQRAMARGDLQEAAAHFAGALRADPGRPSARARLDELARLETKGAPH